MAALSLRSRWTLTAASTRRWLLRHWPTWNHQMLLQASNAANQVTEQVISFAVTADFLVGPAQSQGWGVTTADTIRLEERNSAVVGTFRTVALGQTQGTRALRF